MFRSITIIGTIGSVGTITDSADSAYYTVGARKRNEYGRRRKYRGRA